MKSKLFFRKRRCGSVGVKYGKRCTKEKTGAKLGKRPIEETTIVVRHKNGMWPKATQKIKMRARGGGNIG